MHTADEAKIVEQVVRLFRALRAKENRSLESAADLAGIHRTHLGLLERGERQPTLGVAIQLARAFGYPLSELLLKAELIQSGKLEEAKALSETTAREKRPNCLRNQAALEEITGLTGHALLGAIHDTYGTLDTIDDELTANGVMPVAGLVELANLSSMIGNLLGSALAENSDGLYLRNRPHAYPDLLPQRPTGTDLELKMALETNRPKGHLAKAGTYISFRYVLADKLGIYTRGKDSRGKTVWIWEVKVGRLRAEDFDISNTEGDSGKTAVFKTAVFKEMPTVYFDPSLCPHPLKHGRYPAYN